VVNAVTLEVTPEQAEKLDLARSVGTLSLVLRNQVDNKGVNTAGIMKRQLLAGDVLMPSEPAQVASPAKPAKTPHRRKPLAPVGKPAVHKDTIEVIKGVQKAIVEF
jgi:pilus assembly protein CpaB